MRMHLTVLGATSNVAGLARVGLRPTARGRCHRTLSDEWAYVRRYRSDDVERREQCPSGYPMTVTTVAKFLAFVVSSQRGEPGL